MWEQLIKAIDKDKDGKLSLKEFIKAMDEMIEQNFGDISRMCTESIRVNAFELGQSFDSD